MFLRKKQVIVRIDELLREFSNDVYTNRLARWRASRKERETETDHRLRLDKECQRKSDQRKQRKQLELNIEERIRFFQQSATT